MARLKYTTYMIIGKRVYRRSTNDLNLAEARLGNSAKGYVTLNLSDRQMIVVRKGM